MLLRTLPRCAALAAMTFLLIGSAGCSSDPPSSSGDAGSDAGDDRDVPVFVGPGRLNLTWTVNGMPAADACATAGAATVEMSTPDFSAERLTLPCAQGMHAFGTANAGTYSLSMVLKRSDGSTIYDYILPVTITSDVTTNATIDFSPPGRARLRWTINGEPAGRDLCTSVGGDVVGVRIGNRPPTGANCSAGSFTSPQLQAGSYPVTLQLINNSARRVVNERSATVEIVSGETGETTVDFTAPVMMMR